MSDVLLSLPIALLIELWLGKPQEQKKSNIKSLFLHPISILGIWVSCIEKVFLGLLLSNIKSLSLRISLTYVFSFIAFILALIPAVILSILWMYGHNLFWLESAWSSINNIQNANLATDYFDKISKTVVFVFTIKFLWVLLTAFLMYPFFATRLLYERCLQVRNTLKKNKIKESRELLFHLVGRSTTKLGKVRIIRAVSESISENFVDAVLAPVIAFIIAGPMGLLIYKSVSTLDSMWGYTSDRFKRFGYIPAKCDDILNYIPSRISVILILIAARFLNISESYSFKDIIAGAKLHKSPNSGWSESTYSHVLGIKFRGLITYEETGKSSSNYFIGKGRLKAKVSDLDNALKLYKISSILILAFTILAPIIYFSYTI